MSKKGQPSSSFSLPFFGTVGKRFWIASSVIAFLLLTTVMEIYLRELNVRSSEFGSNILVFLVVNLNVIILAALGLVIIRNLWKLYSERKVKVIGSRFKQKIVFSFLLVAIIPSAFLFWIASGFIYSTVNNWFQFEFERAMTQSSFIGQKYFESVKERTLLFSENISRRIEFALAEEEGSNRVDTLLQEKVKEYGLVSLVVYDSDLQQRYTSLYPPEEEPPVKELEPLFEHVLKGASSEGTVIQRGNSDIVYGITPVHLAQGTRGAVLACLRISPSIAGLTTDLNNSINNFNQLKLHKNPLKFSYIITFLLIFLFILLGAIWFALYLSRGLTVPIANLLDGTRQMATGELNIEVEKGNDAELNLLVDSFNEMVSTLKEYRRKSEEAHRELELKVDYIETVLNNVTAGVVTIDNDGRVQTINNSALEILHLPEGREYKNKHFKTVLNLHDFGVIKRMIREFFPSGSDYVSREIDLNIESTKRHIIVQLSLLHDASGEAYGTLCVFEDVTDLLANKEIAAWQDVARSIAHEIKNPLMPIQLNAERLQRKFKENKEEFELLFPTSSQIIIEETVRLKRMVNEFSEFARMPAVHKEKANLSEVIAQTVQLYEVAERDIRFVTELPKEAVICSFDADQIKRVLINLIKNSIEAFGELSKEQPEAEEETAQERVIAIIVRKQTEEGKIEIYFSDTGRGVDKKIAERLFKPYVTTKKQGTGLGLAMVQRIIHEHGGEITLLRSRTGTVFRILLPTE